MTTTTTQGGPLDKHFSNEPLSDFSDKRQRDLFVTALLNVETLISNRSLHAGPVVAGIRLDGGEVAERFDPSDSSVLLGTVAYATEQQTVDALESVFQGSKAWREQTTEHRCRLVKQVGHELKKQKYFFSALLVREAGKPWREADGDVAEAIDFCFYYADQMKKLSEPQLTEDVLGEENFYSYEPRGVAVVIAPWNFPLAILCGMTMAALVTGNGVLIKPSEQTSLIAHEFYKVLEQVGVASNCIAFLPGRGEVVGKLLVSSPRVDLIAFTGSKSVGLEIINKASVVHNQQRSIKRVIAELGGKNAIIVDSDADLDDAIRGVVHSAFGYTGQKCSACSRLIVVGEIYETFLERLALAVADIPMGKAADPATVIGPVIDHETCVRLKNVIQTARQELRPLVIQETPALLKDCGAYVAPAVFRDVPHTHPVWKEEIFGPVLACCSVGSFDEALEVASNSPYALTGGIFSRHPEHIAKAKQQFKVGNLYINRACTGALVQRQPFGGSQLSGVGSKAGGPGYLLHFLDPRVITENTMRRGFTPDL